MLIALSCGFDLVIAVLQCIGAALVLSLLFGLPTGDAALAGVLAGLIWCIVAKQSQARRFMQLHIEEHCTALATVEQRLRARKRYCNPDDRRRRQP